MNPTQKSEDEFKTSTGNSGTYTKAGPQTETAGGFNLRLVYVREEPVTKSFGTDVDDLIAEYANDDATMEAIAEGRKRLSKTLYDDNSLAGLRLSKGLSQAQLAKMMGTSQPHIANIEAGKTKILVDTVLRLADALGEPKEVVFDVVVSQSASK